MYGIFQPTHLLIVLAIVLVIFGAGKLGQIGGALGQSVKDFRSNVKDDDEAQPGQIAAKSGKSVVD